jgi:chemotaxis response regulator CheB
MNAMETQTKVPDSIALSGESLNTKTVPGIESTHFVVGIGASGGGLEAIEHFCDNVPDHCGLTFVVVQHLSPDFKSLMDELLARHTKMPIYRVDDGMAIQPNAVYLISRKKHGSGGWKITIDGSGS